MRILEMAEKTFYQGDAGNLIRNWSSPPFAAIVTSPPYFGCRDYEPDTKNEIGGFHSGSTQLGHEDTPFDYVRNLVSKFGMMQNASYLKDDGAIWIVIGDSFARKDYTDSMYPRIYKGESIGIDGLLVMEMRRAGWRLHQSIIWNKPSVPPSGAVQSRCNPCHESILIFSKNKPLWNKNEIREESKTPAGKVMPPVGGKKYGDYEKTLVSDGKKCRQDVWTICPSRDTSSHVAPFPEEIARLAILATTQLGDYILDPFAGTRTTERVATSLGRVGISFDIYDHLSRKRSSSSQS